MKAASISHKEWLVVVVIHVKQRYVIKSSSCCVGLVCRVTDTRRGGEGGRDSSLAGGKISTAAASQTTLFIYLLFFVCILFVQ